MVLLRILLLLIACTLFVGCGPAQRAPVPEDPPPISDGPDEYVPTSPKAAWGEFGPTQRAENGGSPWWSHVLLWVPNRVLDLIDVFRVDAGVGPAVGAVVRVTEYGQLGYRQFAPFSLRVGGFGRKFPAIIERSNEIGAGPAFLQSPDREVCVGELGAGLDLFLVGAYGGVCVDELADFVAGLFFIDIKDDDL